MVDLNGYMKVSNDRFVWGDQSVLILNSPVFLEPPG